MPSALVRNSRWRKAMRTPFCSSTIGEADAISERATMSRAVLLSMTCDGAETEQIAVDRRSGESRGRSAG